jgi:hypothetical protein
MTSTTELSIGFGTSTLTGCWMKRGAVKNKPQNKTQPTSKVLLLNDKTYVEQFRAHHFLIVAYFVC